MMPRRCSDRICTLSSYVTPVLGDHQTPHPHSQQLTQQLSASTLKSSITLQQKPILSLSRPKIEKKKNLFLKERRQRPTTPTEPSPILRSDRHVSRRHRARDYGTNPHNCSPIS